MMETQKDYQMYLKIKNYLQSLDPKYYYYLGIGIVGLFAGTYASSLISSIPIVNVLSNLIGFYVIVRYLLRNQKELIDKVRTFIQPSTKKKMVVENEISYGVDNFPKVSIGKY